MPCKAAGRQRVADEPVSSTALLSMGQCSLLCCRCCCILRCGQSVKRQTVPHSAVRSQPDGPLPSCYFSLSQHWTLLFLFVLVFVFPCTVPHSLLLYCACPPAVAADNHPLRASHPFLSVCLCNFFHYPHHFRPVLFPSLSLSPLLPCFTPSFADARLVVGTVRSVLLLLLNCAAERGQI